MVKIVQIPVRINSILSLMCSINGGFYINANSASRFVRYRFSQFNADFPRQVTNFPVASYKTLVLISLLFVCFFVVQSKE